MEDLSKKVLQATSGEHRFNPDEQRHYLGTFAERVALSVSLEDAQLDGVRQHFPDMLAHLTALPFPLQLKLSSELPLSIQMAYMKMANAAKIKATIVTENKSTSPYALIVHSDQPVGIEQFDVRQQFPQVFEQEQVKSEKKSFWARLLNKS